MGSDVYHVSTIAEARAIIYGDPDEGLWEVEEGIFVFPDGREFHWVGSAWCRQGHPMAVTADATAAFCPDCVKFYRPVHHEAGIIVTEKTESVEGGTYTTWLPV